MIRKAMPNDLDVIEKVLEDVKSDVYDGGIDQWDADYPNKEILKQDIQHHVRLRIF